MQRHRRLRVGLACSVLIGTLWTLQGHAGDPNPSSPPTLNEKDLLAFKPKGRGTLAGQVFLTSSSGKAITQAGASVHLIPMTHFTRHWFDHTVRTTACPQKTDARSPEPVTPSRPLTECLRDPVAQLLEEKRLLPYLRTTRVNPTGHFWFTKIPAGRYYLVSPIDVGVGAHQDERASGIAWSTVELETGEKATNLVVTDCRSLLC